MLKKIRIRLYMLRHSLISKWMMMTCLIIIPLNVLSLLLVSTMQNSYLSRLDEQLSGNLENFAKKVETNYSSLENSIITDVLTVNNLYVFSGSNRSDSIMMDLRLKNQLNSLFTDFPDFACFYIWDKEKDFVTFFNRKTVMNNEDIQTAEELIRSSHDASFRGTVNGAGSYVIFGYQYSRVTFGFVTCPDRLALECHKVLGQNIGSARVLDAKGSVIGSYPLDKGEMPAYGKKGIFLNVPLRSYDMTLTYTVSPADLRSIYPPMFYVLLALTLLCFAVIPFLYLMAKRLIMRPLLALAEGMQEVESGNMEYRMPENYHSLQMDYIAGSFNHMTGEIYKMRIAVYEQEIEKLQTETINAHLQVNQHMLLNSLNLIYSLIQTKRYDEANEFTLLLMKYFRYALRKNSPVVTVREEMAFVEDYIRMQKIRLKNRFTSVCQVTDEAKDLEIPQLLIQGFVENAVKYAIVPDKLTEILIDVQVRGNRLLITVVDTGNGMDEAMLHQLKEGKIIEDATGKHVGLWNVRKRLSYYYANDYQLELSSTPGDGTMIHLSLPLHPEDKKTVVNSIWEEKNRQENGRNEDDSSAG